MEKLRADPGNLLYKRFNLKEWPAGVDGDRPYHAGFHLKFDGWDVASGHADFSAAGWSGSNLDMAEKALLQTPKEQYLELDARLVQFQAEGRAGVQLEPVLATMDIVWEMMSDEDRQELSKKVVDSNGHIGDSTGSNQFRRNT